MLATTTSILADIDPSTWNALLGLVAFCLVVYGIVLLVRGQFLAGIGCFIAAALIGPGGISLLAL